jgi:hypothetical protein
VKHFRWPIRALALAGLPALRKSWRTLRRACGEARFAA